MSVFWIPVIAVAGGIGMVIVMVVVAGRTRERSAELRAGVQMKLIDRFGSADEFVHFIQSPEGKQFLGDAPTVARRGYVGGVRSGIILAFLGLAFVLLALTQHDDGFYIPALILLGLGLGFFVSAMVSMKLARDMERNVTP